MQVWFICSYVSLTRHCLAGILNNVAMVMLVVVSVYSLVVPTVTAVPPSCFPVSVFHHEKKQVTIVPVKDSPTYVNGSLITTATRLHHVRD